MEFDSAVLDAYQQALVQAQAQSQRGLEAPDPTQGPAYDASPAVNM